MDNWVDLTFLGGVGEIGLNLMTLETADHLVVVDAGLMFPEDPILGIDIVIPDFSYLRERRDKLTALVLTHGHEDHIGAVPFFLKEFDLPVYGTPLTLALLKEKLREHGLLNTADLREIKPAEPLTLGPFEFEFIRVCHSIVDGVGFVVKTPQGYLAHSGDFKIDQTPVAGAIMDLNRFAHYGEKGVLALMSDSTNAERPGYTLSERQIGLTLEGLIREAPGRVIVAVFASHIHRMQQIVNSAAKFEPQGAVQRQVHGDQLPDRQRPGHSFHPARDGDQRRRPGPPAALPDHCHHHRQPGRALERPGPHGPGGPQTGANPSRRPGDPLLPLHPGQRAGHHHGDQQPLPPGRRGGLQGGGRHPHLGPRLPGRAETPPEPRPAAHFIPIHGELRHLIKHGHLARAVGIPEERLLLATDGDQVRFDGGDGVILGKVDNGRVFVDGKGVGDVSRIVLRDRRHLAADGLVIAYVAVDPGARRIVTEPELITRGFTLEGEQAPLLDQARKIFQEIILRALSEPTQDWLEIQTQACKALRKLFFKLLERRPMILPLILTL